ncbi:hypothetical protein GA0111570_103172 [Raineyella antarctica]|uniref:DUF2029 domain-containing protein n=2 Tax=Raineyella antarctica TaxID=1577474 RepID=A0A1G6GG10_9ACTN|nr:hypothetical protein GA0111570_103172 [Raineyella antarctica]
MTSPRLGLGLILLATVLTVAVGALGPSAVTLTLGPRRTLLPPYYLPAGTITTPNEWVVSGVLFGAVVIGGLGLTIAMRALRDGWHPRVWRVFTFGVGLNLATLMVPPMTSADVLMYAAYGRLQKLGIDPYDITPATVFRSQYDPVLRWTERPWQDTPSVYGPIMTWVQLQANNLGGENMHDITFWLQVFAFVPFLVTSAVVVWLSHGDELLKGRGALLTIANPLLVWAITAGAHNEGWALMFAMLGLMLMRRTSVGAGVLIGLGGACKLSIGLYGLAMAWGYRRQPRKLVGLLVGTGLSMGLLYGLFAPDALFAALRNTSYVSVGSWAQPFYTLLTYFMSVPTATSVLTVFSLAGTVLVAAMLSRVLPWHPVAGTPHGVAPDRDPITIAVRTALLLSVGWLTTSLYTLSWYDLIAWAPLALVGATRLDWLFTWRGVLLSLSYIPGRGLDYGESLNAFASRIRDTFSPGMQLFVLGSIAWWWHRDHLRRVAEREGPAPTPRARVIAALGRVRSVRDRALRARH